MRHSRAGFIDTDHSKSWSPVGRPTLNISFASHPSLSTSSDSSPHTAELPPSSLSSPWSPDPEPFPSNRSQQNPYMLAQTISRPSVQGDGADQHPPTMNQWNSIFSTPLESNMFATLEANGTLGLPSPSLLPNVSHPSNFPPSNPRFHDTSSHGNGHTQASSWSNTTSPFLSESSYMQRPAMSRHSSTTSVTRAKGKSPVAGFSHYPPIQPRPRDSGSNLGSKSIDDRHLASMDSRSRRPNIHESTLQHTGPSSREGLRSGVSLDLGLVPNSPIGYNSGYPFPGERSNAGLPPTLWMSPTSTAPSTPATYGPLHPSTSNTNPTIVHPDSSAHSAYGQSPLSSDPSITADSKTPSIFTDIFSDDLFDPQSVTSYSECGASSFASPRLSGSPDLKTSELDPKIDHVEIQIWKQYARDKGTLPHSQRMENITWRLTALKLKKKKKEEEEVRASGKTVDRPVAFKQEPNATTGVPPEPGADDIERGRGRDKVKNRVVGFDGVNQDGQDDDEYVIFTNFYVVWHNLNTRCAIYSDEAMDWRAMSRSRSRAPMMDWRPASRSRSRPPNNITAFEHYTFPTTGGPPSSLSTATPIPFVSSGHHRYHSDGDAKGIPIPIPIASAPSTDRFSGVPSSLRLELPAVLENDTGCTSNAYDSSPRLNDSAYHNQTLSSSYHSPQIQPSSLPSLGLLGLSNPKSPSASNNVSPSFPRHVRKTSFDHTVSREGILSGLSGRHQVNGKPLSPVGTKRRADAPHRESILRADPASIEGSSHPSERDRFVDSDDVFPQSSFNFNFPPYSGIFDLPGPGGEPLSSPK